MRIFRLMGQVHLWLGMAVGTQVMLWLVSGFVMVLWPIETVRGEHLRTDEPATAIDWAGDAVPWARSSRHRPHRFTPCAPDGLPAVRSGAWKRPMAPKWWTS